jgi:hypothetical protein
MSMKHSMLFTFLLACSAAANSATLVTPSFVIDIKVNCAEGNVTCDDVTYIGKSKKSGNSVKLWKDETQHVR